MVFFPRFFVEQRKSFPFLASRTSHEVLDIDSITLPHNAIGTYKPGDVVQVCWRYFERDYSNVTFVAVANTFNLISSMFTHYICFRQDEGVQLAGVLEEVSLIGYVNL